MNKQLRITVYSTPTCPYCKQAKEFLTEKGLEYKDINVMEDLAAAKEMIRKSGQMGVPVIEADGKIIIGFDRVKLGALLGI